MSIAKNTAIRVLGVKFRYAYHFMDLGLIFTAFMYTTAKRMTINVPGLWQNFIEFCLNG